MFQDSVVGLRFPHSYYIWRMSDFNDLVLKVFD